MFASKFAVLTCLNTPPYATPLTVEKEMPLNISTTSACFFQQPQNKHAHKTESKRGFSACHADHETGPTRTRREKAAL